MLGSFKSITQWILLVCLAAGLTGCSQKEVFQINYLLPDSAGEYENRQVYVTSADGRSVDAFLKSGAAKELQNFSGLFSLSGRCSR